MKKFLMLSAALMMAGSANAHGDDHDSHEDFTLIHAGTLIADRSHVALGSQVGGDDGKQHPLNGFSAGFHFKDFRQENLHASNHNCGHSK